MKDPFLKETSAERLTLRDALRPLLKHSRSAIAGFFVIFAFANVVAWFWAAHVYKSTMQVVVMQSRTDPVITAGQDGAVGQAKQITTDQVSSEVALLSGVDMAENAAKSCGLVKPVKPSFWDPRPDPRVQVADATAKLLRHLKAEAAPTSDVIEVSYSHRGEPETPACVLRHLAQDYVDKHLRLRRQMGSELLFSEETERYKQALSDSEARLVEYVQQTGAADPDTLNHALAQQLAESEVHLQRARENEQADQARIEDVRNQMQHVPQRSPAAQQETAAYFLTQNLQEHLLAAELKRTDLLTKYDPSFPLVKEAEQEIKQTRSGLEEARRTTYLNQTTDRDSVFEFLRQDVAKTEAEAVSSKASIGIVRNSIADIRSQMVRVAEQSVKRGALEREVKANEAKYLLYLNKREQERISNALDRKRIADVAISVAPTVPVVPAFSPIMVLAVGTIFALIVGISMAFVVDYLDPYIRTNSDLESDLGIPVLATFTEPVVI